MNKHKSTDLSAPSRRRKMVDVTTGSGASQARPEVAALISNPRARVLVLGGGINGIATFRDLALQGIDVVLVERGDYCSGASAAHCS